MPIDPTQVTINDLTDSEDEEAEPESESEDETPVPDNPTQVAAEDEETEEEEEETSTDEEETANEDEEEPDTESDDEGEDEQENEDSTDEEPEVSLFDQLETEMGIDLGDDAEYEETTDGFMEFAEDVVEKQMEEQWGQLFEQFPDVERYVSYRMQGGDPDEYQEAFFETTWQDTSVPEDSPDDQKQIIRQNLSEDFEEEEVDEMIEEYDAAGVLETKAKESLRQLQKQEEKQQNELLEKQKQQAEDQRQQIQEYWDDVESTIDEQGEFHGIPVPEGEKEDFFSFMAEDVTDGQGLSRRDQMVQEMNMEDRLAIDLILYYDFDLDQLAEMKAKTKSAQSLRDRLKSSKDRADVTDQQDNGVDDGEIDPERDIPNPTELLN